MSKQVRDLIGTALYLLCASVSLSTAFLLRFDFRIPETEQWHLVAGLWLLVPVKLAVLCSFRIYRGRWYAVSVFDLLPFLTANVIASMLAAVAGLTIIGRSFPRAVYPIDLLVCVVMTSGVQCAIRLYREILLNHIRREPGRKKILIYGAGAAGSMLAREIRMNPKVAYKVVGFLDDDPRKAGETIMGGYRILGPGRDAARLVATFRRRGTVIDEIIIAIPSAGGAAIREAVANCRAAGIAYKAIPGLGELLDKQVLTRQIRDISVIDLLGRPPVTLDTDAISREITDRTVMVTGGCGSIGSELCRQIARFSPKRLVVFDQAETGLFLFEREFRAQFPNIDIAPEIGDICDEATVADVMSRHRIDAIFHAAAYKHVPMMERNIIEATHNNVFGTLNVAKMALQFGCARFLMISSDKAVNPTSVMGLTKRVAELIVSALPLDDGPAGTRFVSVRFGYVLGSNGSVVPIFQEQIAAGGPVTVTHPDMRRYFMTIPEAAQLVLQAYSMGKGSEVFVLDMGDPVRIVDLARNMIRLAGFEPDEDIEIRYTGLRPGEKLFEELCLDGEHIVPTYHEKVKIFHCPPRPRQYLVQWLSELRLLTKARDDQAVLSHLVKLVPEYQTSRKDAAREPRKASRVAVASLIK